MPVSALYCATGLLLTEVPSLKDADFLRSSSLLNV